MITVTSPVAGTVSHIAVSAGDTVAAGAALMHVEVMKMEHRVVAPEAGLVDDVTVAVGDTIEAGALLVTLTPVEVEVNGSLEADTTASPRRDLQRLAERKALLADDARPDAVARRHEQGHRTARENVADLLDDGSFLEYGGLAVAAQRSRRPLEELRAATPADGLITGTGTVNAELFGAQQARVTVAAYDYTVLAGTQGYTNHHKKDRLFRLAHDQRLPLVVFAEGGGGRPGDTDVLAASWLDAEAFHLFARLSGHVPTVAIVNGRCFAGNAALAGCADVLIATEDSNLGMAGPAMIEGGGLGVHASEDIGPIEVQRTNGVVDVVVADEAEAVAEARRYLSYFQGHLDDWSEHAQQPLRTAVPEDRKLVYDPRPILDTVADPGTVFELRRDFGRGMITALARVRGRPLGILANDPNHLGGAIDADGADKAARFLQLCDAHELPVVVLCDTPGFMVGPDAERDAGVRRFSRMFVVGANLRVPLVVIVTRKAYGLGAQAMMGGHLAVPVLTVGWPTSELGPMGLEGAVRLGFRRELEAIDDPVEREEREREMIALAYANAEGLNVASFAEIDDVIDPADTRDHIAAALSTPHRAHAGTRRFIDTW
ncbi:MAG: biotin carboxylase [Actinobacteria bacterium]|nr:biotin carboxylase [Actinomycetota bacterium]